MTDRRHTRALARRAAYEDAADAMESVCDYRPAWKDDAGAVALYLSERRKLQGWLKRRAKGQMGAPPGGVGS